MKKYSLYNYDSGRIIELNNRPVKCPFGKNRKKEEGCCVACPDYAGGRQNSEYEWIDCRYEVKKD